MTGLSIAVVTPWLNAHRLAAAYWDAMRAAQPTAVLVIDNGSDPPLYESVWPPSEHVPAYDLRLPRNGGFARACNLGLRVAAGWNGGQGLDAVLFLNNDVVMTSPLWLDAIRAHLRPGTLVGADLRSEAHAAIGGRRIPYLDGWCLAGMTRDLVELGGFDESYEEPAYFGDNDLCLRAKARGMRLVAVPVGLRHIGGVTRKRFDRVVDEVTMRNRARFEQRARDLLHVA